MTHGEKWVPLSGRGLQIIVPYPKRGVVRRPNPAAVGTAQARSVVVISVEKPATTHQSSTIDYIYNNRCGDIYKI